MMKKGKHLCFVSYTSVSVTVQCDCGMGFIEDRGDRGHLGTVDAEILGRRRWIVHLEEMKVRGLLETE